MPCVDAALVIEPHGTGHAIRPGMFAINKKWVALGLGLVACAGSGTTREPFASAEDENTPVANEDQKPAEEAAEPEPQAKATATAPPEEKPKKEEEASNAPPDCPTEKEPNNGQDDATPFTSCIKGELTGWTDNDNLAITVPAGAAEMVIDHIEPDGKINYAVTSGGGQGGSSNMSFTDEAPKTKVKPGTKYIFALKWDNNGAGSVQDKRSYAIRVAFLH